MVYSSCEHEDGGPWAHTIVEEANITDHHGQSYIIRVTKTGRLITQHETYMQFTNNNGGVHLRADQKRK